MNMMRATVDGEGFMISDRTFEWPTNNRPANLPREFFCGVRPENLHVEMPEKGIRGIVEVIEPMGGETVASLSVGDARLTVLYRDRRPPFDWRGRGAGARRKRDASVRPKTEQRIEWRPCS